MLRQSCLALTLAIFFLAFSAASQAEEEATHSGMPPLSQLIRLSEQETMSPTPPEQAVVIRQRTEELIKDEIELFGFFQAHDLDTGEPEELQFRSTDEEVTSILDDEWPEVRGILEDWLADANFDDDGRARASLFGRMSQRKPALRGNPDA